MALMQGIGFMGAKQCYMLSRTSKLAMGEYQPIGLDEIIKLYRPIIAGAYGLLADYCDSAIISRWPVNVDGPADIWLDLRGKGFDRTSLKLHESKKFTIEQWSYNNARMDDR